MKSKQKKGKNPSRLKLENCLILKVRFYKNGNVHLIIKPYFNK